MKNSFFLGGEAYVVESALRRLSSIRLSPRVYFAFRRLLRLNTPRAFVYAVAIAPRAFCNAIRQTSFLAWGCFWGNDAMKYRLDGYPRNRLEDF